MSSGSEASGGDRKVSKRLKSIGIDRISALPEALIVHILSLLPTGDRRRTGALSTRWRYLWTCVPKLHFNWNENDISDTEAVENVNKTLYLILLSGSKVKDFSVNCPFPFRGDYASDVNLWIRFAARSETQKFELVFQPENPAEFYPLPQHLYTNSSFKELRFECCRFSIGGTVSWSSLKKLSISEPGNFSHEQLEKILAGSPALEFLDLSLDEGISRLNCRNSALKKLIVGVQVFDYSDVEQCDFEISAPSVQSMEVSGYFRTCKLIHMTSLVEATLFGVLQRNTSSASSGYPILTQEVLKSLLTVQTLTLGTWVIQGIAKFPTKDGHPLFPNCKCLTIDTHLWKEDPSAIASLLKSTPQVETLIVTISEFDSKRKFFQDNPSGHGNSNIDQYWTSQEMASNYLTRLTTVKFIGFWAYRRVAIPFVQFLLKNARGLQKAIIYLDTKDKSHEIAPTKLFETFQRLLSFPRSSPDAKLLIYQ